jgi:soluble P-type ATPase
VTADTFGTVRPGLSGVPCRVAVLAPQEQSEAKRAYVQRLGASATACIGNGRNDRLMLAAAALGIAVLQAEGAAAAALLAAHVAAPSIADALDLLIRPLRLIAALRE